MNCDDMIMDLEYQSVDIANNNATHISNVITHKLMMDMNTLFPSPCQMLFETYDYHVSWKSFLYVLNKLLAISAELLSCALKLLFLDKKHSHHNNNDEYMLLEDMQHSHPHIILYQEVIFLSWYGRMFCRVE